MFNTVKRAFSRNVSTRSMSWGVKKMNYSVEMLNKDIPREITANKYGIPYRVVNERAVYSTSSNSAVPKKDTKNTHVFELSFKKNIIVSGKDSKHFIDKMVTCDNKIMEVGHTCKSLMLNESGGIIGLGVVNKFQHYYSLVMESDDSFISVDF